MRAWRPSHLITFLTAIVAIGTSTGAPSAARAERSIRRQLFDPTHFRALLRKLDDREPAVRLSALIQLEDYRRWFVPATVLPHLVRYANKKGLVDLERSHVAVAIAARLRDSGRLEDAERALRAAGFLASIEACRSAPSDKPKAPPSGCRRLERPQGLPWFELPATKTLVRVTVAAKNRRPSLRLGFVGGLSWVERQRRDRPRWASIRRETPPFLDEIRVDATLVRGQRVIPLRLEPADDDRRFAARFGARTRIAPSILLRARQERTRLERMRQRLDARLQRLRATRSGGRQRLETNRREEANERRLEKRRRALQERLVTLREAELRLRLVLARTRRALDAARRDALRWAESEKAPEAALLLALELSPRTNDRLIWLDRLRRFPSAGAIRASVAIALALQQNRGLVAARRLAKALVRYPTHAPLLALELDLGLQRLLLPALSERRATLEARSDLPPALLERLIECAIDQGDRKRAQRLNERILRVAYGVLRHHLRRVQIASELGDHETARRSISAAIAAFPTMKLLELRAADVELALGAWRRAEERLKRLVSGPLRTRAERALGELYLKIGRPRAALPHLESALSREPTNLDLRALVERLRGTTSSVDVSRAWQGDPRKVLALAVPPKTAERPALVNAFRLTAVYLHKNGAADRVHQWIQHVYDPRKLPTRPTFEILYNPFNQRLAILRARVLRRHSPELSPVSVDEEAITSSDVAIYYDFRKRVVTFPTLRRGDVIEVLYRIDEYEAPFIPGYFGDFHSFGEVYPTDEALYLVDRPASLAIHYGLRRATAKKSQISVEQRSRGGRRITAFRVRRLAGLFELEHVPGLSLRAPTLHISTIASWSELARRYRAFAAPTKSARRSIGWRALEKKARDLTRGLSGTRARVAAIHRFVTQSIRYVGLELGVHGYKPYDPATVYTRRFGDCKDKAMLMQAMLATVGVSAQLTLVRTRDLGPIDGRLGSLAVFNHAMLYLPSLRLFADPTSTYNALGELPLVDQDATVLVLDGNERLRRTAGPRADQNRLHIHFALRRTKAWHFAIHGRLEATGSHARRWRRAMITISERRKVLEKLLQSRFPGAHLRRFSAPGIDLLGAVAIRFEASWTPIDGPSTAIRIETPFQSPLSPEQVEEKRHGVPFIADPTDYRESLTLAIDAGLVASFTTQTKTWRVGVLDSELTATHRADRLVLQFRFGLRHQLVEPKQVVELRQHLSAIQRELAAAALLLERRKR
ncbi:MAG: DUF3857 domain-containing protein [Myxococcales bacterium]|nr:DUF3857 domain-containing protein [Myxococcales bacterium]